MFDVIQIGNCGVVGLDPIFFVEKAGDGSQ